MVQDDNDKKQNSRKQQLKLKHFLFVWTLVIKWNEIAVAAA